RYTLVSRWTKPTLRYNAFAASRAGRLVRSTVTAPWRLACSIAVVVSRAPAPNPRASASTTTSSIHARIPVGIGNIARVSMPTVRPSCVATNKVMALESRKFFNSSNVIDGADEESWGRKLLTWAKSSSDAYLAVLISVTLHLSTRDDAGRRRTRHVAHRR